MEKRLVLFFVLSFVIILGYPYLVQRWMPQPPIPSSSVMTTPEKSTSGSPSTLSSATPSTDSSVVPQSDAQTASTEPTAVEKVVETDLYRAVLSSRGGTIRSWTLKKYTQNSETGGKRPISLISDHAPIFPLAIVGMEDVPFSLDATPLRLSAARPEESIEMVHTDATGHRIVKSLRFRNDGYDVAVRIAAAGRQSITLSLGTNFGISDWTQGYGSNVGAISLVGQKVIRSQPTAEKKAVPHGSAPQWLAMQDKYFIGALAPAEQIGVVTARYLGDKQLTVDLAILESGGDAGASDAKVSEFLLYAGPKEYDRLAEMRVRDRRVHLEESIDFGWFIAWSLLPVRLVAKPLFYILNFIYRFCENYGIAIILLTLLVKVAFFPLTKKSMVSMKAMAALQPKMEAIRAKWSKDKTKMNLELMNLYKEHGVNPMSGCLPVLLQVPVFIALFNVLYVTIELRQAPFFLWVVDLSDQDPYYVLPILMGITMLVQQWLQPSTMDPTQAKIMLFLPVIYTFFSISFPSGLILYWTVNNLLTIGQQYFINRAPGMGS